jgi:AcrR family transcriptional regulator
LPVLANWSANTSLRVTSRLFRTFFWSDASYIAAQEFGAMAMEACGHPKRARGRPKTFDRSVALHQAMKLFWERGYVGTSFDDLIAVMGISPSSFYNTFGSKEQLYHEATEAYMAQSGEWFTAILDAPTDTRTTFDRLLKAAAREFTREDLPAGCMISLACTHVPPALDSVRDMMATYRCEAQAAIADRIQRGIEEGDVPNSTNVQALAAFYSALSKGMAVLARDGATQDHLLEIAEIGMRAWPSAPPQQPKSTNAHAARSRARASQ